MTQRPLFLLSLPRSGSTLVQRVLASHDDVATTPEPWLLLPQVYATREAGISAQYVQVSSARAIREFAAALPNGFEDYREEVRRFATALYAKASGGTQPYFLDKTPRYHLIADDLFDLFPDAAFVFLWRNPLAVAASIVETWAKGRWAVERWHVDLFDGVSNLVQSYTSHRDRAITVRFEDLVAHPDEAWPLLFEHLGLSFEPSLLEAFTAFRLTARMGDPTGSERYTSISMEPLAKWKATLNTPVRKRWARRYLDWMGTERLATMGYDVDELRRELDSVSVRPRGVGSDVVRGAYWRADRVGRERAARLMWRRLPR